MAVTGAIGTWRLAFGQKLEPRIMKDFRDLVVWKKAHALTLAVYRVTRTFPREELFGLTSQMRRCSLSIGANIAEGCGKPGDREFQRFLQIASGSGSELDYHIPVAHDLQLLSDSDFQSLCCDLTQLRKMLTSLIRKIEQERSLAKC